MTKSLHDTLFPTDLPRPSHRRRRYLIAAALVVLGIAYIAWNVAAGCRVDVTLTNRSNNTAMAGLFVDGNMVKSELAIPPVKPGGTGRASYYTGTTVGDVTLRVQVGPNMYEGTVGVLVDDDGPHQFDVTVRDGGVTVVLDQSDKWPYEVKMSRVPLAQVTDSQ